MAASLCCDDQRVSMSRPGSESVSVRGGLGHSDERTSCVHSAAGLGWWHHSQMQRRPGQARHHTTPAKVVNKNRWKNAINFYASSESGWLSEMNLVRLK